ncbi:Excitatory amino acid transporter 3, partial [Pseudolycoriella hygida]
ASVHIDVTKPTKKMNRKSLLKLIKSNLLVIATFTSVLLGIFVGFIIRATTTLPWSDRHVMYVNFIGDIFLQMLKSLIVPLITTSLITGIASLDLSLSRKIGGRAVAFYLTTTFFSVVLGIAIVSLIQPGVGRETDVAVGTRMEMKSTTADAMLDLLRNLFPPNIIQACIEHYATELKPPENHANETEISDYEISGHFVPGVNIIGLVVISVVFGIALSVLQSEATFLISMIGEVYRVTMKITGWAIALSPVGIFFLVVSQIIEMVNVGDVAQKLGFYFFTVVLGCVLQGFVILPIIYYVSTRKNPFQFIKGISQALVTAFATSSSSATMPITLKCIIKNNDVDENVAKFMLPIGSAINMDGTALYEAVAALFIAQLRGVELGIGELISISITATAASIGAAGIPSAGLVTMIMVLDAIGLPARDVTIILAVDWLLDRIRTVVNVMGDTFGAGIINHWCRDDISKVNEKRLSVIDPLSLFVRSQMNQSNISVNRNS